MSRSRACGCERGYASYRDVPYELPVRRIQTRATTCRGERMDSSAAASWRKRSHTAARTGGGTRRRHYGLRSCAGILWTCNGGNQPRFARTYRFGRGLSARGNSAALAKRRNVPMVSRQRSACGTADDSHDEGAVQRSGRSLAAFHSVFGRAILACGMRGHGSETAFRGLTRVADRPILVQGDILCPMASLALSQQRLPFLQ